MAVGAAAFVTATTAPAGSATSHAQLGRSASEITIASQRSGSWAGSSATWPTFPPSRSHALTSPCGVSPTRSARPLPAARSLARDGRQMQDLRVHLQVLGDRAGPCQHPLRAFGADGRGLERGRLLGREDHELELAAIGLEELLDLPRRALRDDERAPAQPGRLQGAVERAAAGAAGSVGQDVGGHVPDRRVVEGHLELRPLRGSCETMAQALPGGRGAVNVTYVRIPNRMASPTVPAADAR